MLFLRTILIVLLCAPAPAAAQDDEPSILQGRIDAAADALKGEKRLERYSDARRRDITRFVAGNLLFVLLHELGHALITEMGLPVLGREEDAADSYASVAMLRMKDQFSERVLAEAAKGWFYSDRRDRMENIPVVFYDSHSLNSQRAYQIVCYMVGSDPEKFAALAEETGLPEERRESCLGDYSNAVWSWDRVLKDHRRTTELKTEIAVRYGEGGAKFAIFERFIKRVQLLEIIAQRSSDMFVWRRPFTMEARACGISHAEWNIQTRTLTICYEMAEEFALLYSSFGADMLLSRR